MSETEATVIGKSIIFKGELTGNEDLIIEGKVEGKIELKDHHLTVGKSGLIKADIYVKSVTIEGEVVGNISAEKRIEIRETGRLRGDIQTPGFVVAEGAIVSGNVDTEKAAAPRKAVPSADEQPVSQRDRSLEDSRPSLLKPSATKKTFANSP